jgi:diguanylate cyclase (GGDEF)-like protein/PAS domain S-box-containing protein
MTPPVIGILSPFISGPYFGDVISGIVQVAKPAGARVLAIQTSDPGQAISATPQTSPRIHAASLDQLAGCIVIIDALTASYRDALVCSGKPVVMISRQGDFPGIRVQPDNRGGVQDAVSHLIGHGHRRIAFAGLMDRDDFRDRYLAYLSALAAAGIEADPALVYPTTNNNEANGAEVGRRMVDEGLRSTAVIAGDDSLAIGIMRALSASGLTLPRDQAVIGFDDDDAAAFSNPALSTVRQDCAAIGRQAATFLLDRLAGHPIADDTYVVPTTLVVRQSCGCGELNAKPHGGSRGAQDSSRRNHGLEDALVAALAFQTDPGAAREAARFAALNIAAALDETASGLSPWTAAATRGAIDALYKHSPRAETVHGILDALHRFEQDLVLSLQARGLEAASTIVNMVRELTVGLIRTYSVDEFKARAHLQDALGAHHDVAMKLLRSHEDDPRSLSWLDGTPIRFGCLGLWATTRGRGPSNDDPELEVVGAYERISPEHSAPRLGTDAWRNVAASAFPPLDLIAAADAHPDEIAMLLPVSVGASDWGLLGVVGPVDSKVAAGREGINQWAALLTVALDLQAGVAAGETQRVNLALAFERERDLGEAVQRSAERYALAAEAASGGLWDWDLNTDTVYYSPRWREVLEYTDESVGTSPQEWLGRVHADDMSALKTAIDAHLGGDTTKLEIDHRIRARDGTYRWVLCRALLTRDSEGVPARLVGSLTDIDDRKQLQAKLQHAATHDGLTGLPNRVLFVDRLGSALRSPGSDSADLFAVIFLDLDGFKLVNDRFGHPVGDALLVAAGERIAASLRSGDIAARFGGDEFAILLFGLVGAMEVMTVATRMQERLAMPFRIDGVEATVAASIGVALSTSCYQSPEDMLRDADAAMYRAKVETRRVREGVNGAQSSAAEAPTTRAARPA